MKTIESLGIYWMFEEYSGGEKYQDEVDGLIFYGYWLRGSERENFVYDDVFQLIWGEGRVETKSRKWGNAGICNFSIEIYIKCWPIELEWKKKIESSLRWFIDNGAVISWCGAEYCSPSLEVFDPDNNAGSIYAAFTSETGLICNSELHEEYQELNSDQLNKLKTIINKKF
ncbi:hypothetical protein [Spartinivicinus poritis]|uniref:Uncharacterized protein n=1 Tax=Spartinivicinus poritis TaxID=2994640 RepID=A0ABT5UH47_9GAMM|nr:hypothetical protein [Spartinivicinus sp. A2-2]MDE1465695.1 hypothetical protein [Spartinivicinus sp. A2-2]